MIWKCLVHQLSNVSQSGDRGSVGNIVVPSCCSSYEGFVIVVCSSPTIVVVT